MFDNLKKYKVSIFGETYTVVTDEPEEHIIAAAQLIDASMRDISNRGTIQDSKRIAVLAALQFTTKYIVCKKSVEEQEIYSDKLINLVDKQLSNI